LNHRAQISWGMVTKINDFARLALENDDHAATNLGCWNCHYSVVEAP